VVRKNSVRTKTSVQYGLVEHTILSVHGRVTDFFTALQHCFRTAALALLDFGRLVALMARSGSALSAENLFLPKQLALFRERRVKPSQADDSTRWVMAALSRLFNWRGALVAVQADTLVRWHRKGFRLFWRWKSKPTERSRLPKKRQELIRRMSAQNPSWGQERIANELMLKLGIQVSPRTVQKYLNTPGPDCKPDPKQRWLTFVRNHANAIVESDFFVVVTVKFRIL
jgi:putative transposase